MAECRPIALLVVEILAQDRDVTSQFGELQAVLPNAEGERWDSPGDTVACRLLEWRKDCEITCDADAQEQLSLDFVRVVSERRDVELWRRQINQEE